MLDFCIILCYVENLCGWERLGMNFLFDFGYGLGFMFERCLIFNKVYKNMVDSKE